MPATFAHCLLARKSLERYEETEPFQGIIKQRNHFVVMGATAPDYPYLTDVLSNQILHIGHNWANRMHYENTGSFIRAGVKALAEMDKRRAQFKDCLAWFAGYVSHVIADSYMHPVVNSTVNGTYIFTHKEHGHCELVQDIYIFKTLTDTDICVAASRDRNSFGYLNILDDCSDPEDLDMIHPHIRVFWSDLLKMAHPNASAFFESIDPDTWHKNYKNRVDFASDSRSIFRHVLDIVNAPRYVPWDKISREDCIKYVERVQIPVGQQTSYDMLFSQTVDKICIFWKGLFRCIENAKEPPDSLVKNWNLDTGVDETNIDLWMEA